MGVDKSDVLKKMREAEAIYVLMSDCTRMPFVVCDPETYDDQVLIFFSEAEAMKGGQEFLKEGNPLKIFNIENKYMLPFYSSLFPAGVNGMWVGKDTEEEIKQALSAVGKNSPEDELNCSGCGYDSCRDFAVALVEGRAEENMCVSYMRRVAHDKATVLLQKIPAGVLLVDNDLKISDMNSCCADLLGEDVVMVYEASPGLQGVELDKICSFTDLFRTVLNTGKEITERQIREGDKIWLLSIYNIQPHRLVFGILQDLREPYVRKEWMLEKTQEVVRKYMATVQEVACLLGENAAFTDATLRSIMEAGEKVKS